MPRLMFAMLVLLLALAATPASAQVATWPPAITAGGSMPVTWNGILQPSKTDWIGLYAPEGGDYDFIEWIYVGCSQVAHIPRANGTCGFVIPSTVPPGVYEIRLYANDGFAMLSRSPKFEVVDGGWR